MISEKMTKLGNVRSVIREIFEYGNKRAAEIGRENVFDFSLGNPSVPAPKEINNAIRELLDTEASVKLHGYTSAPGDLEVRKVIADSLNRRFGTDFTAGNLYMTMGAAASLSACLKALCADSSDEFITFTPFFPEYRVFTEAAGGKLVEVKSNDGDFQIDFDRFTAAITPKTKAVIVNSPNNPSGVVLSKNVIEKLCDTLRAKSTEYGHTIFLISDEPYRELVYDNIEVPYLPKFYNNTLVCYSFSKSLSLPGERIGYVVVPSKIEDFPNMYAAVCGAGRALGYVCAPSLFQRVVAKCIDCTADIAVYKKNRDLLLNGLESFGYECVKPDGAFYLFVKSMEPDAWAFCEKAKKHELLLVPGDDFGCPGYVRISYCVSTEQIERSMPAFEKLAKEYK